MIGSLFGGVVYSKIGIKRTFMYCFGVSVVGSVAMLIFGDANAFVLAITIICARFGCSSMFCVVYLGNSDIFPPLFSSTIFGICNTCSRILTILAPIVAEMKEPTPIIIFIIFSITGVVLPNAL